MRVTRAVGLLLALLVPLAAANIHPISPGTLPTATSGAVSRPRSTVAAENAAIAASAEAAVADDKPTQWLVSFKAPEEQVAAQASLIASTSAPVGPAGTAEALARQQVYSQVKSRVLGPAAATATAAAVSQEAAGPRLTARTTRVLQDYSHLPITFVSISNAAELARLRANPDVVSVRANGIIRPMLMQGLTLIGQPDVLSQGILGSGTVVTIDTGLDYTRAPALFGSCTAPGAPASCRVLLMKDIAASDGLLDDGDMHGTNVAGIIATVAPGVKLINLDVFGPDGTGSWNDLITAINWAVANKGTYNITTINMSLGGGDSTGPCDTDPLAVAVNSAYDQGVLSAAAAGNEASTNSMLVPACASKAVSVGAVHPVASEPVQYSVCNDVNAGQPDTVACFSNSDTTLTMLAPGVAITAAGITMSGTSQATPFVSASLAVLRNRFPSYSLAQVVSAITSTGVMVTDTRNGLTRPRLNLKAAAGLTDLPSPSPTPPTPTPSPSLPPPTPPAPAPGPAPGGDSCSLSATSGIRAANTGGTYTLTVTPLSPGCSWTASIPSASWVRIVGPASGTGPGTVTVQFDPVGATARNTGLVLQSGSRAQYALLSQAVVGPSAAALDSRPPVQYRVTALNSGGVVRLSFPPAQDIQSGVSAYHVVYSKGVRPPSPRCTTGTTVDAQPTAKDGIMQMSVSGLVPGTRYTFRVCALDGAGNVSAGTVWRGRPS